MIHKTRDRFIDENSSKNVEKRVGCSYGVFICHIIFFFLRILFSHSHYSSHCNGGSVWPQRERAPFYNESQQSTKIDFILWLQIVRILNGVFRYIYFFFFFVSDLLMICYCSLLIFSLKTRHTEPNTRITTEIIRECPFRW